MGLVCFICAIKTRILLNLCWCSETGRSDSTDRWFLILFVCIPERRAPDHKWVFSAHSAVGSDDCTSSKTQSQNYPELFSRELLFVLKYIKMAKWWHRWCCHLIWAISQHLPALVSDIYHEQHHLSGFNLTYLSPLTVLKSWPQLNKDRLTYSAEIFVI